MKFIKKLIKIQIYSGSVFCMMSAWTKLWLLVNNKKYNCNNGDTNLFSTMHIDQKSAKYPYSFGPRNVNIYLKKWYPDPNK